MGYPRIKQIGEIEEIFFWTTIPTPLPGIFTFFNLLLEVASKTKLHPLETPQNCVTSLRNFKVKYQEALEIPHGFFLITPGNFTLL